MSLAPRWPNASPVRPTSTISTTTSRQRLFLLTVFAILNFSAHVSALFYVPGSPCESVCADSTAGTLHDDVRCLDDEYDVQPGLGLRECITCQLNSTAVDTNTGVSDVAWALYNLRYTLSNCMFAYPEERVSISSPCQVTCTPLKDAVVFDIVDTNLNQSTSTNTTLFTNATAATVPTPNLDFCTRGRFENTIINNCAFCYSFIPQQLFLGNVLQALHIACRSHPVNGHTFYPDGVAIYTNATTIAGPSDAAPTTAVSVGLTGTKLILAIVLPLVAFLIILGAVCFGCWHFTRKRRQDMAASGRMSRFHDGKASVYSPVTPGMPGQPAWHEPPTEMERITVTPKMDEPRKASPGHSQGRWVEAGTHDDGAGVPLNTADRQTFAMSHAGVGIEPRSKQDSQVHEQFIGVADGGAPTHNAVSFRAQDGYVQY